MDFSKERRWEGQQLNAYQNQVDHDSEIIDEDSAGCDLYRGNEVTEFIDEEGYLLSFKEQDDLKDAIYTMIQELGIDGFLTDIMDNNEVELAVFHGIHGKLDADEPSDITDLIDILSLDDILDALNAETRTIGED